MPKGYTELYEKALQTAALAHHQQRRKGRDLPYIIHPLHVSVILLRHGFSTTAAAAGLLHDVVEDQDHSLDEIAQQFGPRVARIVSALSEKKYDPEGKKRPWSTRKQESLEKIRDASLEAVAVKTADTLHNTQSFVEDLRRQGPDLWQHFNRGPDAQLSYYRQVLEIAQNRLGDHPLVKELSEALETLERVVEETTSSEER
jgi:(p)ppGpp synthase/HD superfamily hydrolase